MINEHVFLASSRLLLVPYLKPFVPRYHEWMCDPALLAATESEPLTLEEEYENQHSWLNSCDKLTFILLAPIDARGTSTEGAEGVAQLVSLVDTVTPVSAAFGDERPHASESVSAEWTSSVSWGYPGSIVRSSDHTCELRDSDEGMQQGSLSSPLLKRFAPVAGRSLFAAAPESASASLSASAPSDADAVQEGTVLSRSYVMIGDCNLFLLAEDEEGDEAEEGPVDWANPTSPTIRRRAPPSEQRPSHTFEVEVMVADAQFRRRGLAELAVRMMMQYAVAVCGATRFVAKILDSNSGSIALFTTHLRFNFFKEVKVFHEMHFARRVETPEEREAWRRECEKGGAAALPSLPLWWCGPLTERVTSALQIYTRLPTGCALP